MTILQRPLRRVRFARVVGGADETIGQCPRVGDDAMNSDEIQLALNDVSAQAIYFRRADTVYLLLSCLR